MMNGNFFILFTDLHVNRSGIRTSDRGDRYHHLYHDQKCLISVVIGAVGEIALVIVYVVKSSIFQGGIQKVLNVFNLSGHYDNFTKGVFDVTGIVYFIFCYCDLPVPYHAVHSERDAGTRG